MSMEWPFGTQDINGARERLLDASRNLGGALREAGARMTRGANAGAEYTRAIGRDVLETGQRATRSARSVVEERPLEALLIVGLTAFALGWVMRRVQEATHKRSTSNSARRAPARPRRRAS
jgi:hypothetical protein